MFPVEQANAQHKSKCINSVFVVNREKGLKQQLALTIRDKGRDVDCVKCIFLANSREALNVHIQTFLRLLFKDHEIKLHDIE